MSMKMTMAEFVGLEPCPFCGGEADVIDYDDECWVAHQCANGTSVETNSYATEAEAIAAWNIRVPHVMLTAEQVSKAVYAHSIHADCADADWQAIADELNELGSGTKPCYAADENYKRCKYSVNRGWCDDAPFLVWDDTGHLFITTGGLKTWDVTDDAKKWFSELMAGECEGGGRMSDETTLLPCPFCGGEAEMCHVTQLWEPRDAYWVKCKNCRISGTHHTTEAEAIAAWNSRAELGSKPPYDELLRCLENDWNIRASWDGLRKFWSIELTEEGVRLRDAELNSRAERTCKQEERGWGTEGDHARVWLTCGHDCMVPTVQDLPNYCPNCGARVVE